MLLVTRIGKAIGYLTPLIFLVCLPTYADSPLGLVSRGKPYSVQPEPNYRAYTREEISSSLTDGYLVNGKMWTSSRALTWLNVGRVRISMDLGEVIPIEMVKLHSSAGSSGGVRFPAHIYAYGSSDDKEYSYLGDLVGAEGLEDAGSYRDRYFALQLKNLGVRYLRLEVTVRLPYFSVDEVEVYGGLGRAKVLASFVRADAVLADVDSRIATDDTKRNALRDDLELKKLDAPASTDPMRRRAYLLRKAYANRSVVTQWISPWAEISPLEIPRSSTSSQDTKLLLPVGMCDYKALLVSNTTDSNLDLALDGVLSDGARASFQIFESKEVRDEEGGRHYDPIVPIEKRLALKLGESKFLMVRVCGLAAGEAKLSLIGKGGTDKFQLTVDLKMVEVDWKKWLLPAITWSYLEREPFASSSAAAVADLAEHHEDAIVLPVGSLGAYPAANVDRIDRYLNTYDEVLGKAKFKRVMLFVNLKGRGILNSEVKKAEFKQWYKAAVGVIAKHGWDSKDIYLYPYDEPSGDSVREAGAVFGWMKTEIAGAKIFVTINHEDALPLLRLADISVISPKVGRVEGSEKGEVWLYDTQGPAKTNDIYSYYRLMPWQAVARGLAGVGFWGYSAVDGSNRPWDDRAGGEHNYSPIYIDDGRQLRSSRRWEAWRAGLEDAALLRALDKKKGKRISSDIAKKVISYPLGASSDAESVRQRIIQDLGQ